MNNLTETPDFALVLLPDPDEISELDDPGFIYSGGYSEYKRELETLQNKIEDAWHADSNPRKADELRLELPPLQTSRGYFPDFVFELSAYLSAGAVGAGLFNLLSLWVKKSNGRKLRVRLPTGLEVDATQMKQKEFENLISRLHAVYGEPDTDHAELWLIQDLEHVEQLLDDALTPGYLLSKAEAESEKKRLKELYIQNRERISKRLEKPSDG